MKSAFFLKKAVISISLLVALTFSGLANAVVSDKGYKELHVFTKVLHYVDENYVEEVNNESIIQGAIRGLLFELDPHSVYLPPKIYKELRLGTAGRFQGVGVEVGIRKKYLTVISPIKNSPAAKAGIRSGDKIVGIDGKPTSQMDLSQSVTKIRGKKGSKITLSILRKGNKKHFDITLTRSVIKIQSVKSELLDDNIGYISVSSFQHGTEKELKKALEKLHKNNALNGLVLDLRQNPGGLVEQSVSVSDIFLDKGTIVTTESRGKEIDKYEAHKDGTEPHFPIIIMVDGGTASAAEIVAGALKDNNRAIILGETTFGKGSVQTVIELEDGGALKLTIAKYYTPSGNSIQEKGIIPDINVPAKKPSDEKDKVVQKNSLKEKSKINKKKKIRKAKVKDYQKQIALAYLKNWLILKHDQLNKTLNKTEIEQLKIKSMGGKK